MRKLIELFFIFWVMLNREMMPTLALRVSQVGMIIEIGWEIVGNFFSFG